MKYKHIENIKSKLIKQNELLNNIPTDFPNFLLQILIFLITLRFFINKIFYYLTSEFLKLISNF